MLDEQVNLFKNYMSEYKFSEPYAGMYPLFCNIHNEKHTRAGVNHILFKYAAKTRLKDSKLISEKISCHLLRHSKAMHLLEAGINLIFIRDILGYVSATKTKYLPEQTLVKSGKL